MVGQDEADVRGREVGWSSGTLDQGGDSRLRRVLTRVVVVAGAAAGAAGLPSVVAARSVISPVGAAPRTPLWMAPPSAAREVNDVHKAGATPSPSPSAAASTEDRPTSVSSADDRRESRHHSPGEDRATSRSGSDDRSGEDSGHSGSDDSGRSGSDRSGSEDSSGRSGSEDSSGHSGKG